ncbi:hypothetical protein OG413_15425 [Streptomyces sp. NBC_01433]|uniref:hypothetical protein n=1 Tax=Streptomyces sp. NBC_01433 TaxID=2903864 RepID=UPI00225BC7D8|nr:hypothetical protein [Streptomyces sp. NBC_01433]MCX4676674.1 hypothetical protein [Streptomyces sp. NBC_01433]
MSITRTLRRAAAVALLAALPALAAPAVSAAQPDRTVVVADPGWGVVVAESQPDAALMDPGWG